MSDNKAQFNFYLNRQGVTGKQGAKGEKGFSPVISVEKDTLSEYILRITNESSYFLTTNLRESKEDRGGTYIRYDRDQGVMYSGDADRANKTQYGEVRFATAEELAAGDESTVITPADLEDATVNMVTTNTSQDINGLKTFKSQTEFQNNLIVSPSGGTATSLSRVVLGTELNTNQPYIELYNTNNKNAEIGLYNDTTMYIQAPFDSDKVVINNYGGESAPTGNAKDVVIYGNLINKNNSIASQVLNQDNVTAGNNITIDKTSTGITINSTGGGGGTGDVTAAGDNTFTGTNTFNGSTTVNSSNFKVIANVNTGLSARVFNSTGGGDAASKPKIGGEDIPVYLDGANVIAEVDNGDGTQSEVTIQSIYDAAMSSGGGSADITDLYQLQYGTESGSIPVTFSGNNITLKSGILITTPNGTFSYTSDITYQYTFESERTIFAYKDGSNESYYNMLAVYYGGSQPATNPQGQIAWFDNNVWKMISSTGEITTFSTQLITPIAKVYLDGKTIKSIDYGSFYKIPTGASDAYTKQETDELLLAKQDKLTASTGILIDNNNISINQNGIMNDALYYSNTDAAYGYINNNIFYQLQNIEPSTPVDGFKALNIITPEENINSFDIIVVVKLSSPFSGADDNIIKFGTGDNCAWIDSYGARNLRFVSFVNGNLKVYTGKRLSTIQYTALRIRTIDSNTVQFSNCLLDTPRIPDEGEWVRVANYSWNISNYQPSKTDPDGTLKSLISLGGINKTTSDGDKTYNGQAGEYYLNLTRVIINNETVFNGNIYYNNAEATTSKYGLVKIDGTTITTNSEGQLQANIPSNLTTQGNTFNGASQLVQMGSDGKLPAIDGSKLTNLPSYTKTETDNLLDTKVNAFDMVEVPVVIEQSDKSLMPSWYRVWSNGWIEQGGQISVTNTTTVNLLKPYTQTNYLPNTQAIGQSTGNQANASVSPINVNSFSITSSASTAQDFNWYCVGY